ncbi:MAG: hypothetical protein K9G60_14910 [Pseudolabrys sp.]|nr:hypothetical protein [Pseudolabrys sp.]
MNMISERKEIIARIEALENVVFGKAVKGTKPTKRTSSPGDQFKGSTGGLRLLISKGFFDSRRKFSEIEAELNKQGYHYSKQAIQTPLNRLSNQSGPLIGLKQGGHKVYVKRK